MIIKEAYSTLSFRAHLQPLRLLIILFEALPRPASAECGRWRRDCCLRNLACSLDRLAKSFSPAPNPRARLGQGSSMVVGIPSAQVLIIKNRKDI